MSDAQATMQAIHQVEIQAESMQTALDKKFLTTSMPNAEYQAKCAEINAWQTERTEAIISAQVVC